MNGFGMFVPQPLPAMRSSQMEDMMQQMSASPEEASRYAMPHSPPMYRPSSANMNARRHNYSQEGPFPSFYDRPSADGRFLAPGPGPQAFAAARPLSATRSAPSLHHATASPLPAYSRAAMQR